MILKARKRQRGQILPIAAAAFVLMSALAGLAIDASRDYLTKRNEQNAADFAVLAAAKQMALTGNLGSPIASGSNTLIAAHDFAANNGFNTLFNASCDQPGPGTFTTTWFDTPVPCTATAGFTNKVSVNSPPISLPGSPAPLACAGPGKYSCVQVVITTRISELFTAILGIGFAYVTAGASAIATLAGGSYDAPPPNAVTLYEPAPGPGCVPALQQCFNEALPVKRTLLSCDPVPGNNCPTFWARPGTQPKIYGYDGAVLSTPGDYTAVRSNGDMVFQDRTTICDPYNNVKCKANTVIGASGFAVPAGAKLYCTMYGAGGSGTTPCTAAGQAPENELDSRQSNWPSIVPWIPTVDESGLTFCGSLILNGDTVSGPCANVAEPYTIGNGIYDFIVINHGKYEFGPGLYSIRGRAPVNTQTAGGYIANGIDHSKEVAADYDLCTTAANNPAACPTLRAGVWIGHGGGSFAPYSGPTPGSCVNGVAGSGGGGGDTTVVSGSGVVFRLESTSGGFVTTHEIRGMSLAGAGVGALPAVNGAPLLFDLENNSYIHLDSQDAGAGIPPNTTSGIIYQTSNAKAGGVEFNPRMAGFDVQSPPVELPAIQGQILAYSLTIFGTSGGIMDFTHGYGGGSIPGIGTSGRNETQIIGAVNLTAGAPGFSILTVNYTDEFAMDAYDVYVKINNGSPTFFSQGIWSNPTPPAGSPLPPPDNLPNPGDNNPQYPDPAIPGTYDTTAGGNYIASPGATADWLYTIPGGLGATIEATGNWTWGHESTIPGSGTYGNTAQLIYTFPNPVGNYLSVTVFILDGDRCGDYAYANYTFRSTGGPGPGVQSVGSVSLVA